MDRCARQTPKFRDSAIVEQTFRMIGICLCCECWNRYPTARFTNAIGRRCANMFPFRNVYNAYDSRVLNTIHTDSTPANERDGWFQRQLDYRNLNLRTGMAMMIKDCTGCVIDKLCTLSLTCCLSRCVVCLVFSITVHPQEAVFLCRPRAVLVTCTSLPFYG